ncbi:RDD family protein [Aeoliella mucimassa]|uniref:RDD family protein n=1 Tax=Aeoliella mucimassa TaxID=2527972 RepID=A0A518AWB2_9BACT|nr:RDD family protein [Aeoliella mucimassa]QDU58996.1 RDD family protein [Aeoliella mucimassa]
MPDPHHQIDTHIRVVTPENIGFEYRVASPFERLIAYLLDTLVMGITIFLLSLIIMFTTGMVGLPEVGMGAWLIVTFLITWFYGGFFETYMNGQTPGKRAMGLRVVRTNGGPINAGQAVLRNFLRVADGLPTWSIFIPTYLVGLVATSLNTRYQRLGDLACGTMVIVEERTLASRFNEMKDVMLTPIENMLPLDAMPSRSLAKAISQYVDRRRYFGPARRAEIARHVGEVFAEKYNLPQGIDYDALLCVLYRRTFLSHQEEELVEELPLPPPPRPITGPNVPRDFEIPQAPTQ